MDNQFVDVASEVQMPSHRGEYRIADYICENGYQISWLFLGRRRGGGREREAFLARVNFS